MNPESERVSGPSLGLLQQYRPPEDRWDEMVVRGGAVRHAWAGLASTLEELGSEDVRRRKQALEEELRLNGVTYNVYGDSQGADRLWSLDPVPMILESAEWETVERGLIQRAELLDAILRDVYGPERLMREGLLPALFLYSHPGFQRACSGNRLHPAADAAFLFRRSGRAGRRRLPRGERSRTESFRLRLRPREPVRAEPHPAEPVPAIPACTAWRASSNPSAAAWPRRRLPGVRDPFVVLLTAGPENETYFEQAYLASYLGLPLVRGGDLSPRDGGIHLLSLEGSRRVDVILRRVDDSFCDPLELNGSSLLGVPGLLQAVRNRKRCRVQRLGQRHSWWVPASCPSCPRICQPPVRPGPAPAFRAHLVAGGQGPARRGARSPRRDGGQAPVPGTQAQHLVRGAIDPRAAGKAAGAHPRQAPSVPGPGEARTCPPPPASVADRLEARSLVLRSFLAAARDSYVVMPGGLARVSSRAGQLSRLPARRGVSARIPGSSLPSPCPGRRRSCARRRRRARPVPKEAHAAPTAHAAHAAHASLASPAAPTRINRHQGPLPGYATENLFWLGRYQERLACQARVWRVFLALAGEGHQALADGAGGWLRVLRSWQPGFPDSFKEARVLQAHLERSLDEEQTLGSPAFNRAALRRTARAVRDVLPDDCWQAVNSILDPEGEVAFPAAAGLAASCCLPAFRAWKWRASPRARCAAFC